MQLNLSFSHACYFLEFLQNPHNLQIVSNSIKLIKNTESIALILRYLIPTHNIEIDI
jgi:hypothetical protein